MATNAWEQLPSTVDTINNEVSGVTTHFSTFGLGSYTPPEQPPRSGGSSGGSSSSTSAEQPAKKVVDTDQPLNYPYCTTNVNCKEGETCKLISLDNGFVRQCVKEETKLVESSKTATPLTGAVTGKPADTTTGVMIILVIALIGSLIAWFSLRK